MNICFNGAFLPATNPVLTVHNRSFKWGDGLFETAKVFRGKWLLDDLHFERLFTSMHLLDIEIGNAFTQNHLVAQALELCRQNQCFGSARVRLAVFRQEDNTAGYSIEAVQVDENVNQWQEEGLTITLFPFARKSTDAYANLKTANFLPYVLARHYAVKCGADDAIVLNAQNLLCDSSKANLFLIRGNKLLTPALHQGCINGVMRRVVLEEAKKLDFQLHQDEVSEDDLLSADEAFLTNAIQLIRWVRMYKQKTYTCVQARKLYEAVHTTIFRGLC